MIAKHVDLDVLAVAIGAPTDTATRRDSTVKGQRISPRRATTLIHEMSTPSMTAMPTATTATGTAPAIMNAGPQDRRSPWCVVEK